MIKPFIALMTAIFFWASAFVGIRYCLDTYSPGALALFRFAVASLAMGILYPFFKGTTKVPLTDAIPLLFIGILGIGVYNICLNYGEITVSAGMASFLIGQIPIFTLILSFFLLKERPRLKMLPGLMLSILGITLIALNEQNTFSANSGVFIILIAAFLGAFYTITQRKYLEKYHPVIITAWVIWGGTLILAIFSRDLLSQFPHSTSLTNFSMIYLGIFPASIAYVAWCYTLRHISATGASMFLYTMPLFSTLLAFVLLHEQPTSLALTGGIVAMAGAFMSAVVFNRT